MADRGFVDWNPNKRTLTRIEMVKAVLEEDKHYLPLTLRTLYYRCVGRHGYGKTDAHYQNLGYVVCKMRRSRMIDWESIRDDGIRRDEPYDFSNKTEFAAYLRELASDFRLQRQQGQGQYLVVWCESAGMVPQVAKVAHEYGVPVISSSGYDSLTAKLEAAEMPLRAGRNVTVLHIGDYDEDGLTIFRALQEDVQAFAESFNCRIGFERIAVTPLQITQYQLPAAPAKARRRSQSSNGIVVQAEALPFSTLLAIVRSEIETRMNMAIYREVLDREALDRARIISMVEGL